MKIIHVNFSKTWRGGERQVFLLMQGLRQQKIEQVLICRQHSAIEAKCKADGLNFYSFPNNIFTPLKASRFIKKLECKGFSIIHCHESKGHTAGILAKTLWRSSQKLIIHRRVIFPIRKKFTTGLKFSKDHISCIICISKAVEKVVHQNLNFEKTVVIPSMVPITEYSSTGILRKEFGIQSKFIIGYIAALTHEKDHITFLKTARKLIDSENHDLHFVIVGEGKLKEELIITTAKLQLQNHVTFTGFIKNVEQILPEIDILLFTSVSEGLGTTILDFFVAKRPVVCVKNGGSEEIIKDGQTGFICEKGDINCLSSKVETLLSDPGLAFRITENAYEFVRKHFNTEYITRETIKVYKGL